MKRPWIGYGFAALSILIFSTNTPIARGIILDGMEPLTLAALRFVLATLLFAIVLSVTSLGKPSGDELPLDRRIWLIGLVSGAINGIVIISWYSALQTLDASLTAVLGIAMFPTATLIILAFAGEPITARKVVRLLLVMIGLYFLVGVSGELNLRGVMWVVLAGTSYGLHLATVQWYMQPYNTWATTAVMMGGGAIIVVILWLANGASLFVPGWQGWLVVAYQVVILTFFGRTILYAAIDRIGSGQYALLSPIRNSANHHLVPSSFLEKA